MSMKMVKVISLCSFKLISEVQQRRVLWCLTFCGFAVNYMVHNNLNIAIVEMVQTSHRYNHIKNATNNEMDYLDNTYYDHNKSKVIEKFSIEKALLNLTNSTYDKSGFDWSEYEQGLVLGSYFWAHWMTQILGGALAMKFGTKLIFGGSNVLASWICFLIPMASYWSYKGVMLLRLLQGLITGLTWPAMHVLTAKWIPPDERSHFVTSYLGSSVGLAFFHPTFGFMLKFFSWEWVFHLCGILGTLWWLAWLYYVYDTPSMHPRITPSERHYIETTLGTQVKADSDIPTPWRCILLSQAVWMNILAQWGSIWGVFTLMAQVPTYFRTMHNWSISSIGLVSGLPHIIRLTLAIIFSLFADYLLHTGKLELTYVRKIATSISNIAMGIAILGLALFGYNDIAAAILFSLAVILQGTISSGSLAALVDLAPNHAGILLGISSTIDLLPGFISPYIVSCLTYNNQTFEAWQLVFYISSAWAIISGLIFVLFGDASLQRWNDLSKSNSGIYNATELEPLKDDEENKSQIITRYDAFQK